MFEQKIGKIHPIQETIREMSKIFIDMGFEVAEGPIVEDEWHNFDALNTPKNHPSRDMQDTFFVDGEEGKVLRTHTSNAQIRFMEKFVKNGLKPPFKIIVPGKCFRQEATDSTHEVGFYQIEGLVVGKNISLAHLRGTLEDFFTKMFGVNTEFRFRPGFFPFVEPGIEVDLMLNGKWIEVLGAGMVHPNVFKNVGLDPHEHQGFAFGPGVDRIAMVKYGVNDIRLFYTGDLRLHNAINKF